MIQYCIYTETGRVIAAGNVFTENAIPELEENTFLLRQYAEPGYSYVDKGIIYPIPDKPNSFYEFNYSNKEWEYKEELEWEAIRNKRDKLLNDSDWVNFRAAEQNTSVPQEWLDYRQALRDITDQELPVTWPTEPE